MCRLEILTRIHPARLKSSSRAMSFTICSGSECALTFIFNGNALLAIGQVRLTHDAGTQFRAYVDFRCGQASPLERQPEPGFGGGISTHASLLQRETGLANTRCPPVPVQHFFELIHGAVRRAASLEFRPGYSQQMVSHDRDLVDVHLPGTVQPRPCPAGDKQAIERGDFVLKELSPMARRLRAVEEWPWRGAARCGCRDSWLPGRNPGNSQRRKAVAWEAAENGVTNVRGLRPDVNGSAHFRRPAGYRISGGLVSPEPG